MKYEDMHLADLDKWNQVKTLWNQGNFDAALAILQDTSLTNKVVNAAVFNNITSTILSLEDNEDDTFKQDIIKVSATPPSGIKSGEVYFEV